MISTLCGRELSHPLLALALMNLLHHVAAGSRIQYRFWCRLSASAGNRTRVALMAIVMIDAPLRVRGLVGREWSSNQKEIDDIMLRV